MKKSFVIIVATVFLMFAFGKINAAEKAKDEISTVKLIDKTVEFSILSSKPFIFGSNMYILHIGDKLYTRSKQDKRDDGGIITFLIPLDDFYKIPEGLKVYITYGSLSNDEEPTMDELSKQEYYPCWYLGQFTKNILEK